MATVEAWTGLGSRGNASAVSSGDSNPHASSNHPLFRRLGPMPHPLIGKQAPEITLPSATEEAFLLQPGSSGRPMAVFFYPAACQCNGSSQNT